MKYLKYFLYIIKHKWYVMIECFKIGLIWRGIVHDISKFLISEFIPYAFYFYGSYEDKKKWKNKFNIAWNKHQKRNKHHYQYWILINDDSTIIPQEIPEKYIIEMICDWIGASKAITGKDNTKEWYKKEKDTKILHEKTRNIIERYLYE